ncbi:hypothetical protein CPC16_003986 [Podila verticillata]|nr:hypothetical protein CPC16_003986 [Podila verticillata]
MKNSKDKLHFQADQHSRLSFDPSSDDDYVDDNDSYDDDEPMGEEENLGNLTVRWPMFVDPSATPTRERERLQEQAKARENVLHLGGMNKDRALAYAPHFIRWEAFCDQAYGGDYIMTVEKIMSFLKEVMFVETLPQETESEVNFRIGKTESNPLRTPEAAAREAEAIRGRFEAGMFPKVQGVSFPDFARLDKWSTIKLLRGKEKLQTLTSDVVRSAIRRLRASGIKHDESSRYAVAVKGASKLGLSVKRPDSVVPRVEISEAITMAGFHDAPYSLDRDCVIPPLPLQRLVFPMIEKLCDDDPEVWGAHCDAVMMDPLEPRQAQVPALANSPLVQDGSRINDVSLTADPLPRRNESLPHQPERQNFGHHIEFDYRLQDTISISDDDESVKDLEEEGLEEEELEEENLEEVNLEEENWKKRTWKKTTWKQTSKIQSWAKIILCNAGSIDSQDSSSILTVCCKIITNGSIGNYN